MSGPCSFPKGDKREWERLNEIVCGMHVSCDGRPDLRHEYMTRRMLLMKQNRLVTGKT